MKKLFGMVVLLFLIYFLYQIIFMYFQGGHNINYELKDGKNIIKVNEILKSGNKDDDDNYSVSLNVNNVIFNVQTFYDFKRSSNIIKKVKYYEDNTNKCIFIRFRNNKVLNDILCIEDSILVPYHNLNNVTGGLKDFANSVATYGYDGNKWQDDTTNSLTSEEGIVLYTDNLIDNHYIGISAKSGFYRINTIDKLKYVKLYTESMNMNNLLLKGFIDDKYIVANYDDDELYRFYISNLTDNGSDMFASIKISRQSYSIGSQGTSLYIYDPVSKKEYELDYSTKTILEVGNAETGITYYAEGKWQRTSSINNISNIEFGNDYTNDYTNNAYEKIIKVGHRYGYYYLFKKVNDNYVVYRSDITKKESIMYLFTTSNIDNLVFTNDYIYYTNNGSLKYYSDETGNRTVLNSSEILSNSNVSIGVYTDK